MHLQKYQIRWSIVLIVALIVAGLFFWESKNLKIETDILESMPHNDPCGRRAPDHQAFADAGQIIH